MANLIGSKIITLEKTNSTNSFLLQYLNSSADISNCVGVLVSTQNQVAGRGQKNNFWESLPLSNLTFSFALFPKFVQVKNQFLISKMVSLSIIDFLKSKQIEATIKWPNDIYYKNFKIAGILIENAIIGDSFHYVVVGVGLNVNQVTFTSTAPNPLSMKSITGIEYNLDTILTELISYFNLWYDILLQGNYEKINNYYLNNLFKFKILSEFKKEGENFNGTIVGVSEFGALQVLLSNNKIEEFGFKEIEFVL